MTDITIADAVSALGVTEYVINGEPTTEEEFNEMFRKVVDVDSNGVGIQSDKPSDFGVTWAQASAKKSELINAEPMRLLRLERNRRLAETDWMASSDVTMADDWKTYRQALRDVPAQEGVTGLDNVKWPTKPE